MASESHDYDFIIVGGGTAGLVVAARLSEDPSQHILVLEAGADHSEDPRVKTPAFYMATMKTDMDWDFETEAQGKALGGSSIMNAHVFAHPTKKLIDTWASLGNDGWDWEGLRDYYTRAFTTPQVPPDLEKTLGIANWTTKDAVGQGPIRVSFPGNPLHPIRESWAETFQGLGYRMKDNLWTDPLAGIGAFSNFATIDPDRKDRNHTAKTYYYPIRDRKNLKVLTKAVVEKVLVEGKPMKAVGVQYQYESEPKVAIARKEVIIAAGVFQSPKLLELSGIGNANLLSQHGIQVVKNLTGVGENLQDHLVCDIVPEAVNGLETLDALQDPEVLRQAMHDFAANHTGLLTSAGIKTFAYMPVARHHSEEGREALKELLKKSQPSIGEDSIQGRARNLAYYNIAKTSLLDPQTPSAAYLTAIAQNPLALDPITGERMPPSPGGHVCFAAVLAQPLSRGCVHIQSRDSLEAPAIDPSYLTNPLDLEIFAEHMLFLHVLATTPPLSNLVKQPLQLDTPSAHFHDLDAAKKYVQSRAFSMWHPAGTCAMLPEDKGGVVDTQLKVYGVGNLRVVDSSIVPILPPGHLQSTVYAVAEKAADLIKKEYGLV
ncbi:hypothetical protein SLS62_006761 [Diatrype stigma]|uniref:Glucose-methanol-choline oxidoreductase N-terminal domain-containing protein n=1 Tax=Diatrype stigma TaxID=117547 RepID=A0AAN9YRH5_9PEZI